MPSSASNVVPAVSITLAFLLVLLLALGFFFLRRRATHEPLVDVETHTLMTSVPAKPPAIPTPLFEIRHGSSAFQSYSSFSTVLHLGQQLHQGPSEALTQDVVSIDPDDAGEEENDSQYSHKETALEKSVAFLMNFPETTKLCKPLMEDEIPTASAIVTTDPAEDYRRHKEVCLEKSVDGKLPVKYEVDGSEATPIKVSFSGLQTPSPAPATSGKEQPAPAPSSELQPPAYLLDPSTFAPNADLESSSDEDEDDLIYETDRIKLQATVADLLKDFQAERTVTFVNVVNQHQGLVAEYVQPEIVVPTQSTPLQDSTSPLPPRVSRSRIGPVQTLGSRKSPTASLKSTNVAVAKLKRATGKVILSKVKTGGMNAVKENLKVA